MQGDRAFLAMSTCWKRKKIKENIFHSAHDQYTKAGKINGKQGIYKEQKWGWQELTGGWEHEIVRKFEGNVN